MESDYGAPLAEPEIDILENDLDTILEYLPEVSVKSIAENGFWERKEDIFMTRSINNRDCVFVFYEGDIAKCGIEKAYFDGKVKFRKPLSCHLFPIRVNDFGGAVLKYEKYEDCKPAVKLGKQTKLSVFEFCKDALIRAFGEKWYNKMKAKAS